MGRKTPDVFPRWVLGAGCNSSGRRPAVWREVYNGPYAGGQGTSG